MKFFARLKKSFREFRRLMKEELRSAQPSRNRPKPKKLQKQRPAARKKVKKAPRRVKKAKKKKAPKKRSTAAKKARPSRKASSAKPVKAKQPALPGKLVGMVTHYFPKVRAAALIIQSEPLHVNDTIAIVGKAGTLRQKVDSLQIDRVPVPVGKKGDEVGIRTKKEVFEGDKVYKI